MSVLELIQACAESNDSEAWEEFVTRFRKPISIPIKRVCCQWGKDPLQFVDDLLQETYLKLYADNCRLLLEFARQHSDELTLAYIKTIAAHLAHDHFKSRHSKKRGAGETDQWLEDFNPEALPDGFGGPEAIEHYVLLGEIEDQLLDCAAGVNQERDCTIFRLYYLQSMSAKTIAALANIELGDKGVESVIYRLTRCLRERLGDADSRHLSDP